MTTERCIQAKCFSFCFVLLLIFCHHGSREQGLSLSRGLKSRIIYLWRIILRLGNLLEFALLSFKLT